MFLFEQCVWVFMWKKIIMNISFCNHCICCTIRVRYTNKFWFICLLVPKSRTPLKTIGIMLVSALISKGWQLLWTFLTLQDTRYIECQFIWTHCETDEKSLARPALIPITKVSTNHFFFIFRQCTYYIVYVQILVCKIKKIIFLAQKGKCQWCSCK